MRRKASFVKPALRYLIERPPYLFLHSPSTDHQEVISRAGYRLLRVTEGRIDGTHVFVWKLAG